MKPRLIVLLVLLAFGCGIHVRAEGIRGVAFAPEGGLSVAAYTDASGKAVTLPAALPLFTCTVNDALKSSADCSVSRQGDSLAWSSPFGLAGSVRWTSGGPRGWKGDDYLQKRVGFDTPSGGDRAAGRVVRPRVHTGFRPVRISVPLEPLHALPSGGGPDRGRAS